MDRIGIHLALTIGIAWSGLLLASGKEPPQQPNARERLNQVLDAEGGIQVYKDHEGNVTNTTVLPNGERVITVQPSPSPSINLGPPLQLHNQAFQLPPSPPAAVQPPAPEFPQKAR